MVSFNDFVRNQALKDELPFGIDFDIQPPKAIGATEVISTFTFPKYNELLNREAWFYTVLDGIVNSSVSNSTLLYRRLGRDLVRLCESITDEKLLKAIMPKPEKVDPENPDAYLHKPLPLQYALVYITNPPTELATSQEYLDFEVEHKDDLANLIDSLKLGENAKGVEWVKVTFFMISRIDGNWTHSDTGCLLESQIESISKFITREANKGVDPEPLAQDEEIELDPKSKDKGEAVKLEKAA